SAAAPPACAPAPADAPSHHHGFGKDLPSPKISSAPWRGPWPAVTPPRHARAPATVLDDNTHTTHRSSQMTTGQGSAGNVIAAICSFIVPGLGQLVQGRLMAALLWFL